MADASKFRFCIDRGGTFTDVYAEVPQDGSVRDRSPRILKLLSEDPQNYENAPREGIRRVLEETLGIALDRTAPLDASRIEWIRMGTTVATNGLLEREGASFVLVATQGLGDVLEIGTQARPLIFDIRAAKLPPLYAAVVEARERVRPTTTTSSSDAASSEAAAPVVSVVTPLDETTLRRDLEALRRDRPDITGAAIAFAHSYAFPDHEIRASKIARDVGFAHVSASSQLLPMAKLVARGQTACVDAYLTPLVRRYIDSFAAGFENLDLATQVLFMQSDGGMASAATFSGFRAVLSGPAGGVVGYSRTTQHALSGSGPQKKQKVQPVIGFDMGGTSTDVSRYDGERFEHVLETETAGVKIQCPQLDINTVAAGGGSRLFFREGAFVVGPESAKAHPGPVCYRKPGGVLAVTDANLVLGRLLPERFPSIFGPDENLPLDREASRRAFDALTAEINAYFAAAASSSSSETPPTSVVLTPEAVAAGFVRVANEAMCRPIRELSEARGHDPATHVLACFGGAGAQHVCAVARALGIRTAVVHAYAGILSAYGMGLADVVLDETRPVLPASSTLDAGIFERTIDAEFEALEAAALETLCDGRHGGPVFARSDVGLERFLNLRYAGTDNAVMVPAPEGVATRRGAADDKARAYAEALHATFRREYGFELGAASKKHVVVDDVRVRAVGRSAAPQRRHVDQSVDADHPGAPTPDGRTRLYFEETGWVDDAPVYDKASLTVAHQQIAGPAVIAVGTSTCVLEPGTTATLTAEGDLVIDVPPRLVVSKDDDGPAAAAVVGAVDPARLGVFSHRFMSIAEQMGRTLQRTASSVNIKERLDFSCAIFAADGGLVANAPHVPVHLGAMAETVRAMRRKFDGALRPGDVVVANDPNAGGSHLPDITVVTPVFSDDSPDDAAADDDTGARTPRFFCASRGHHADVGGSTPGSMPADSTTLVEEGAVIDGFLLVDRGVFDEAGIIDVLSAPAQAVPPRDKPDVTLAACRNMADSLSDLKAQVAANAKGVRLLRGLCDEYGEATVAAYMRHVRDNAEHCVRAALKRHALRAVATTTTGGGTCGPRVALRAEDRMDDGNPIALTVEVDVETGAATFDFASATGPQVRGNWNAPTAVTAAACMYCVRLLVGRDIPLNSGCLDPIDLRLLKHKEPGDETPGYTMLAPSPEAAVCAGNVLTSMRVTDVVLKAFRACAASQGCMNNFTFGDASFGYYETIAGGAGAGPDWHGTSAVQVHMTNTRITDVETLETSLGTASCIWGTSNVLGARRLRGESKKCVPRQAGLAGG
mmetsp:Transcript_13778/g.55127  ORF Transcript_13778/g.55127 Transcript_13778/m.55127 type:complete len:1289 (-) Transcript_13778:609-4475(-)